MKHKKLTALLAVLAVSALGVGALSYYSGTAKKKQNDFNIVAGQKDQNDAGTIQEPAQDAGGKADAAAGLQPDQIVPKDPYIVSNVDQSAWAIMKVEVPKFTEAPNTGKLTAELLNVNADGKQKLLKEIDTDVAHTIVYGYTEPLAGNNSMKPENERAKTSSLFNSFKIAGDIELSRMYTGAIKVTGTLIQTDGNATVEDAADSSGIASVSYHISYNLGGGSISGEKTAFTSHDYGYMPPTPTREYYDFIGQEPENIADGTKHDVTFTAKWKAKVLGKRYQNHDDAQVFQSREPDTYTVEDWEKPTTATIKKYGYSLVKWEPESIPRGTTGDFTFTPIFQRDAVIDSNKMMNKLDSGITAIQRIETKPDSSILVDDNNIVDTSSSAKPVYMQTEGTVVKQYSEASNPLLQGNCSYMFSGKHDLTDISGLSDFDVSTASNFTSMFEYCTSLTDLSPIKDQDVSNIISMSGMFRDCSALDYMSSENLDNWKVSSVTDMSYMFYDCTNFDAQQSLSNQDVRNVTNFYCMFGGCPGHPTFSLVNGEWDGDGTFIPTN